MLPVDKLPFSLPVVSVIVPCHDSEDSVWEALESIGAAAAFIPKAIELIVIDDGSVDATTSLIESWMSKVDPKLFFRMSLLQNNHQGPGVSRNVGIDSSIAPWVAFLDSDDEWIPQQAAKAIALVAHDPECEIYSFACIVSSSEYSRAIEPKRSSQTLMTGTPAFWRNFYRRSFVQDTGARFGRARVGEDLVFLCALAVRQPRVHFSNFAIYQYRLKYSGSLSSEGSEAWLDLPESLREIRSLVRQSSGRWSFIVLAARHLQLANRRIDARQRGELGRRAWVQVWRPEGPVWAGLGVLAYRLPPIGSIWRAIVARTLQSLNFTKMMRNDDPGRGQQIPGI